MIVDVVEHAVSGLSFKVVKVLLSDKTTKRFIVWGTDSYARLGEAYEAGAEIYPELIMRRGQDIICPRVLKTAVEQANRTKKHAEVFTPSWICNLMNNHCDEEWFGRPDVFNTSGEKCWTATTEKVVFPEGKTWQKYVDSRRLEITCGEAPYLVSRYDPSTGEPISIPQRVGILDRKLRVVNENAVDEEEWLKWAERAIQSVYGYEYQGDNLFFARLNVLLTFSEYLENRWGRKATEKELVHMANIIAWNLWQMDGLKGELLGHAVKNSVGGQMSLFGDASEDLDRNCYIHDWRSWETMSYKSLMKGK